MPARSTTAARRDRPRELEALSADVTDERHGFFGPESLTWRINREAAVYLGGMRALLLQLAHPKVAQAVADHSDFRQDPYGRLRRTFDTVHAIVFGNRATALDAAERLYAVHERITGRLSEPIGGWSREYRANDPELLLWVYATLVDSALVSYSTFVGPLTRDDVASFHEESKTFARLVGVEPDLLPPTHDAFADYFATMVDGPGLHVTATALCVARALLRGPSYFYLFRPGNHVLAAGMLPPRLRREFGLSWNLAVRAAFSAGSYGVRSTIPLLPAMLRFVPSSRRAERRCGGPLPVETDS